MQQCRSTWRISFYLKRRHKLTGTHVYMHTVTLSNISYRHSMHHCCHSIYFRISLAFHPYRCHRCNFSCSCTVSLSLVFNKEKKEITWKTKHNISNIWTILYQHQALSCYSGNEWKIWYIWVEALINDGNWKYSAILTFGVLSRLFALHSMQTKLNNVFFYVERFDLLSFVFVTSILYS